MAENAHARQREADRAGFGNFAGGENEAELPHHADPTQARVDWSPQQLDAKRAIAAWLRDPGEKQVFRLDGYAGTGKTTLLQHVARQVEGLVNFAAYTGKAASVMRAKGCDDATTIDKLIYHHPYVWHCRRDTPCSDAPCADLCRHAYQEWTGRQLNPFSPVANGALTIIDEHSMVGHDIGADLVSFGTPVLVFGDHGQLPPINGDGYFATGDADIVLTEIHRQAAGNPVIALATMARLGEPPPPGKYGDSEIVHDRDFHDDLADFDIVICGRNSTRQQLNKKIRQRLGFDAELPMLGEKLVVRRNRHAKGIMNGEIVTVIQVDHTKLRRGSFLPITVKTDDERQVELVAPIELLLTDSSDAAGSQGDPVTFGYALTCHKSQGSQWDSVLVVDESACFREHKFRWLYTAITRAVERVTIVWG